MSLDYQNLKARIVACAEEMMGFSDISVINGLKKDLEKAPPAKIIGIFKEIMTLDRVKEESAFLDNILDIFEFGTDDREKKTLIGDIRSILSTLENPSDES